MMPPIHYAIYNRHAPLKVQAGIVTNKGQYDIFLFGVEDDVPVAILGQLQAFSFCILGPGQSVDIEANPHIGYLKKTDLDKHITIHSLSDIEVDIESHDVPTSWQSDHTHPWNGGMLPGGYYTLKYSGQNPPIVLSSPAQPSTPPPPGALPTLPSNTNGNVNVTLPKGFNGQLFKTVPPSWIEITVSIDTSPKCTCGEKSTKHPGRCSSWCDLEKSKNV